MLLSSNIILRDSLIIRDIFRRKFSIGGGCLKGHSHAQNTKAEKEKKASIKSKIFSDFSQEIVRVVREGGADPDINHRLASMIGRASRISYPKEKIQESISIALKKTKEGPTYDVFVDGYCKIGFNLRIWGKSSSREHFTNEVKRVFKRNHITADSSGSMKYNFSEKVIIRVSNLLDENDLSKGLIFKSISQIMFLKAELGVQHIEAFEHPEHGHILQIIVDLDEVDDVVTLLKSLDIFPNICKNNAVFWQNEFVANQVVDIPENQLEMAQKVIDSLSDIEDVVKVFDNIKNMATFTIKID